MVAHIAHRHPRMGGGMWYLQESQQTAEERLNVIVPISISKLFERWGLVFIGSLKVRQLHWCRYIVVATEYLTKWAKARALPDNTLVSTTRFIYEQIVTRYNIPIQITSNRGGHFVNHVVHLMMTEFRIFHNLSSPYYPRMNRQAKSTKKVLVSKKLTRKRNRHLYYGITIWHTRWQ